MAITSVRKFTYDFTKIDEIDFMFTKTAHTTVCQNIITFDIEASNGFYDRIKKIVKSIKKKKYAHSKKYRAYIDSLLPVSLAWIWQCAIESSDGSIFTFIGRTEEEFYQFWTKLNNTIRIQASVTSKMSVKNIIYIHNLAYEFNAYLRNIQSLYMDTDFDVFARANHKPIYARIKHQKVNTEFRCSLFLTNKSLKNWCKDENLPVQKREPIDYLKLRTPNTPVTDEEIEYCVADVVSMVYGIEKYRDKYGTLQDIPYTSTGEIRRVLRNVAALNPDFAELCYKNSQSYDYDIFIKLIKTYQGGWTHANAKFVNQSIRRERCCHLTGFDFASSYPSVMTNSACYPLTPFEKWDVAAFSKLEKEDVNHPQHAFFFHATFRNVESKLNNSLWSFSKAEDIDTDGIMIDNGRIHKCKSFSCWMTGIDWDTFKRAYKFDPDFEVDELYVAQAGYLPTCLVEVILDAFADKTALKGIKGEESKYAHAKQIINGIYGLMVFKMLNWVVTYDNGEWEKKFPTIENGGIEYYNELLDEMDETTCHTWYAVGVYCTAMARHRIWEAIIKLDDHIFYVDTDSIKGDFDDYDIAWINKFNQHIIDESNLANKHHGFTTDRFVALTKKGVQKRLGIFELDGTPIDPDKDPYTIYKAFRTLGAKRYCYEDNEGMHTTIAGLPKKAGPKVIKTVDDFTEFAEWNVEQSDKVTVYYTRQEEMIWHGCDGSYYKSESPYGVCLKPTTFDMSSASKLIAFMNFLYKGEVDENVMDTNRLLLERP